MMDARWGRRHTTCFAPSGTSRGRTFSMRNPATPLQRLLGLIVTFALLCAAVPALQVAATPARGTMAPGQVALLQQDATDATAGSVGQDGTVNGQPRETSNAPADTINPAAPGQVMLPPSVPGVPGNANPALANGIASTQEVTFSAIADTTVFLTAPSSPQTVESAASLAIGGPNEAVALISFSIEGLGDAMVLGARLSFQGTGIGGGPGGSVGVIYGYVTSDGTTANDVPSYESALNVHGAPAWFERVEPAGITQVDVTGSIYGDGTLTFVLPGQREQSAAIYAMESGIAPELILTVGVPG
jgi:hypothetical protein